MAISRQVVLDTETTGLDPASGHRVIEIACVELVNRRLTGHHFHTYLNPDRAIDPGAQRVHGITLAFLQDKPRFVEVMAQFLEFVQDAELVIHNAPFDLGFLNSELKKCKSKQVPLENHLSIIDTLVLARARHPGQKNNLDALCKRYFVDNSKRTLHGALMDAEILAQVYLAMTMGQETMFGEMDGTQSQPEHLIQKSTEQTTATTQDLVHTPSITVSAEEKAIHQDYLNFLRKKSGAVIAEW